MTDGWYRALVLMTPESGAGSGPANVSFTFQLPGYEPVLGEVVIRPYSEDVPVQEVEMIPTGDSFGSLQVEFMGATYLDDWVPRSPGPEYELTLREKGGNRLALKYSIPLRESERVDGIPSGVYDVVFEGLGKSLKITPAESPVRIGPDLAPSLTLELGVFGSIEVEVVRADGSMYDSGPIKVQLITETEPGLGLPMFYHLAGPPYIIRHVAPGPHYLVLLTPEEIVYRNPEAVPLDTVFVTESHVSTTRFVLP